MDNIVGHAERYTTNCKICGKEINTYQSKKCVCPGECRKIANRCYAKEFMRRKRNNEKEIVARVCVICKKEFTTLKINNKFSCFDCEQEKLKAVKKTTTPDFSHDL